jgi:hypothetical protein
LFPPFFADSSGFAFNRRNAFEKGEETFSLDLLYDEAFGVLQLKPAKDGTKQSIHKNSVGYSP